MTDVIARVHQTIALSNKPNVIAMHVDDAAWLCDRIEELEADLKHMEDNRNEWMDAAQRARPSRNDALREGFLAGANAVHNEWAETGTGAPEGEPDFSEAASDFALALIEGEQT